MPFITSEGNYKVKVVSAYIKEWEKELNNDPGAFIVTLFMETPDSLNASYNLFYSNRLISNGKNAGKSLYQNSEDLLKKLGVKNGLINLYQAIEQGLEASIKVETEVYEDKEYFKVKYVNPITHGANLNEVDIEGLLAKLHVKTAQTVKEENDDTTLGMPF